MGKKKRSIKKYTWKQFDEDTKKIIKWLNEDVVNMFGIFKIDGVYGIPKGGLPLAVKLCNKLDVPLILDKNKITDKTLVVDDISDTGKTLKSFIDHLNCTIFIHEGTNAYPDFWLRKKYKEWIVFPWE